MSSISRREGVITVLCVEGGGWKDKDLIGKSDPFCVVRLGSEKQKTPVSKGTGTKATWNHTMTFSDPASLRSSELEIEVFDSDLLFHDKLGKSTVALADCVSGLPAEVPLQPQGFIRIVVSGDGLGGASTRAGNSIGTLSAAGSDAGTEDMSSAGAPLVRPSLSRLSAHEDDTYYGRRLAAKHRGEFIDETALHGGPYGSHYFQDTGRRTKQGRPYWVTGVDVDPLSQSRSAQSVVRETRWGTQQLGVFQDALYREAEWTTLPPNHPLLW
eukprot:NODE_3530_length_960_cov_16.419319_g3242_i0.p1 GENE.NODE_3530_length_960_cov_16.419319_g3242_i0~~NODE_3530_length_960_cov_16.419319_g3242_i0.p1  ORF type:complete len:310 (+),score=42.38 NODE_3530_length_960_cov_16.419319_g3242_i0:123-932(+)